MLSILYSFFSCFPSFLHKANNYFCIVLNWEKAYDTSEGKKIEQDKNLTDP